MRPSSARRSASLAYGAGRIAGRIRGRRLRLAAVACAALSVGAYAFREVYSPSRAFEPGMLFLAREDNVDDLSHGLLALAPTDVDGDGMLEQIVGVSRSANGRIDRLEAWSSDGVIVAAWSSDDWCFSSPLGPWKWAESVGDTDGDGLGEVLLFGPTLVTLATGVEKQLPFDGRPTSIASSADLDRDGRSEIVAAGFDRAERCVLRAIDGASGELIWSCLADETPGRRSDSVQMDVARLGDLDGDSIDDFAWLTSTALGRGHVLLVSGADGSVLRHVNNDRWRGVAAAGDLDGDGRPDLALHDDRVAAAFVELAARDDGQLGLESYRFELPATQDARVIAIGDLDGDGRGDLLAAATGAFSRHGLAEILRGVDGSVLRRIDFDWDLHATSAGLQSVGDVDGDGVLDLMVCAPALGEVDWLPDAWRVARSSWVAIYSGRFLAGSGETLHIR